MHEIAYAVAQWMYETLPGWVRLPSLTFELPHAVYWVGLALFPLVAAYLVRREAAARVRERITLPISYLLLMAGGFAGLHRFYLRAPGIAVSYIGLFLLVLYGNRQGTAARNLESAASNELKGAEFDVERYHRLAEAGREGAAERLAQAREALVTVKAKFAEAAATVDQWEAFSGGFAFLILILLLVDAVLIPRLRRRCAAREAGAAPPGGYEVMARGSASDARRSIQTPVTRVIDALSGCSGHFVAYWSVIAVFAYYFEVIARYVFNSPTNWAHESMFLMFGMQYLLSGAFALREDAHVRVDVIYERLGERTKAWVDIGTSFFFFVFTVTLLITGAVFAMDAVRVWEVSFTEWAIQYWPVKLTIAIGALLIVLQGLAKLIRDATFLARRDA